jgi:hypothetical protein
MIGQKTTTYSVSISVRSKELVDGGKVHSSRSEAELNNVTIRARSRDTVLLNVHAIPREGNRPVATSPARAILRRPFSWTWRRASDKKQVMTSDSGSIESSAYSWGDAHFSPLSFRKPRSKGKTNFASMATELIRRWLHAYAVLFLCARNLRCCDLACPVLGPSPYSPCLPNDSPRAKGR